MYVIFNQIFTFFRVEFYTNSKLSHDDTELKIRDSIKASTDF